MTLAELRACYVFSEDQAAHVAMAWTAHAGTCWECARWYVYVLSQEALPRPYGPYGPCNDGLDLAAAAGALYVSPDAVRCPVEQRRCVGCSEEIDETTCWCGDSYEFHNAEDAGHVFVAHGCKCHYRDANKAWDSIFKAFGIPADLIKS